MGNGSSCVRPSVGHDFLKAVESGDSAKVELLLCRDPEVVRRASLYRRFPPLHVAAANGRLEILAALLERFEHPDTLNRHKQTPLMLTAMYGTTDCLQKLIDAGANILMFDSDHGRTCLHYAAYYGQKECLQEILSAARSSPVADSWGFARFVNVRDKNGATPLHLAARQGQPDCVHILLDSGALVSASTCGYSYPGSTPLHLAARAGSLDCVRELLAWGADRKQTDSSGRIPYTVALRRKHRACAALLNPTSAEPLVWPASIKFIDELNPDAKSLLEAALMEANWEREKNILKGMAYSLPTPTCLDAGIEDIASEASEADLCCICFEQACTIEVQDCGHQMCAHCILALCCHNKPSLVTLCSPSPVCPFCRSNINKLIVAKIDIEEITDDSALNHRKSWSSLNFIEGSCSFKGMTSDMGSFGKIVSQCSGKAASETDEADNKS